jgi:hypothetical protein
MKAYLIALALAVLVIIGCPGSGGKAPASSGGNLIWAKSAGEAGNDLGRGITTLSDNSTIVTGRFQGSATFGPGEPNQTVLTSAGSGDGFIARFNP